MEGAAKSNIKKVQLQLSGKSSQIVCADADLQNAAVQVCVGAFINNGQSCCAGSRILVQEEVLDEFLALFMHQASMIYAGDPFQDNVALGPLINKAQFEKVLRYIESGVEEGATLVQGGQRQGDTGYFIEPTVFYNCTLNMRIMREEIFGPVVGIMSFKTLDEAIEMANDTDYGLAGGVYTTNLETAINVSAIE
jgi:aldehyde dehydrogenase (NAD+)